MLYMDIEILTLENDVIELKTDNITVAEILRAYLNQEGIKFAAWRREHPAKPIIFRIESSGKSAKKAVSEAVAAIKKDLAVITKSLKK